MGEVSYISVVLKILSRKTPRLWVSTSLNLLQKLVEISSFSCCYVEEMITSCWTELLQIYGLASLGQSYKSTTIIKNVWAINMEKGVSYQTHMVGTNADMIHPRNIRDFSLQSDGDRCTKPKHWDYLLWPLIWVKRSL